MNNKPDNNKCHSVSSCGDGKVNIEISDGQTTHTAVMDYLTASLFAASIFHVLPPIQADELLRLCKSHRQSDGIEELWCERIPEVISGLTGAAERLYRKHAETVAGHPYTDKEWEQLKATRDAFFNPRIADAHVVESDDTKQEL